MMDLDRFAGIARCYGTQALTNFNAAHVAVIGVGGVGSWVVEALARSGVGQLSLFDLDDLCLSNTNRQLPALEGQYGQSKVQALASRVNAINPACRVNAVEDFVTEVNVERYLTGELSAAVDACDAFSAKKAMALRAKRLKLPLFVSGAAGGQIDPGQIKTADLSKTIQDPLLAKLRRELRAQGWPKDGKKMGLTCVYSTEQPRYPALDGTTCSKPEPGSVGGLDCGGGLGATMPVTATFAMQLVSACLNRLAVEGRE